MRSNGYWTPRYVWSASAIATTLLHAGGIWWAITQWPRSPDIPPAPIEVMAVPIAEAGVSSTPPTPEPVQRNAEEPTAIAPSDSPPVPETPLSNSDPVPETANTPASTPASPASEGTPTPPVSSNPGSTESTNSAPAPQTTSDQDNPSPSNPPSPSGPSSEPPTLPSSGEEPPMLEQLLYLELTLEPLPGSDLNPDALPAVEALAFAPGDVPTCPPLSPINQNSHFQITLELAIENGLISNTSVKLWENSRDRVYDSLIRCLIQDSPPTLIAASSEEVGLPKTYKALLRVNGNFP